MTLLTAAALPLLSTPKGGGYESMAAYAFSFAQDEKQAEAAPAVAEAIRRRFTPPEAEALLARIMAERLSSGVEAASKANALQRARAAALRKERAAAKKTVNAPKPAEKRPPPPRETRRLSIEEVRDRFEADLSKFPLDERVWSGGLSLHLTGIAKWDKHYAVKLAVSNRTPGDFFVKSVAAETAGGEIESFPLFPMLVEKGRTRDGFLLFAAPARGAEVKIQVKEDGEEGRALRAPVRYPF